VTTSRRPFWSADNRSIIMSKPEPVHTDHYDVINVRALGIQQTDDA